MTRWHSCNVLQVGDESRRIWQFDASKDNFTLDRQETIPVGTALPDSLIGKNWRSIGNAVEHRLVAAGKSLSPSDAPAGE